jgi:hypothetical protein
MEEPFSPPCILTRDFPKHAGHSDRWSSRFLLIDGGLVAATIIFDYKSNILEMAQLGKATRIRYVS